MTRVKETPPGSGQMPEYKSHPSRINASLREAYDGMRARLKKKSEQIDALRGNKRDLEQSRNEWKKTAKKNQLELNKSQAELAKAERYIEQQKKTV